uniref:Uncharacterized protein n=1 Tax=Neovison vison TaxID=452646 RepID=A0A8C7EJ76_NEOVI
WAVSTFMSFSPFLQDCNICEALVITKYFFWLFSLKFYKLR